jgi:uncharacterized protein
MDAPRLVASADGRGCRLSVRAQPGARRSGPVGLWNEHLKIAVRAPADDGRANAELLEVLAATLGLRPSELEIVRGERARSKEIHVARPLEWVRARLLSLAP